MLNHFIIITKCTDRFLSIFSIICIFISFRLQVILWPTMMTNPSRPGTKTTTIMTIVSIPLKITTSLVIMMVHGGTGIIYYYYYYYSSLNSPYGSYFFYWGRLPGSYYYIQYTEMKLRFIEEESWRCTVDLLLVRNLMHNNTIVITIILDFWFSTWGTKRTWSLLLELWTFVIHQNMLP